MTSFGLCKPRNSIYTTALIKRPPISTRPLTRFWHALWHDLFALISIEPFTTAMPKLTPVNNQKQLIQSFSWKKGGMCDVDEKWGNKLTVQALSCSRESLWAIAIQAWPLFTLYCTDCTAWHHDKRDGGFIWNLIVLPPWKATMAEFTIDDHGQFADDWQGLGRSLLRLWNSHEITR